MRNYVLTSIPCPLSQLCAAVGEVSLYACQCVLASVCLSVPSLSLHAKSNFRTDTDTHGPTPFASRFQIAVQQHIGHASLSIFFWHPPPFISLSPSPSVSAGMHTDTSSCAYVRR